MANARRSVTPIYQPGQKVWLSTQTAPALPETQSQICWPLHHPGTNQSSHLQTPTVTYRLPPQYKIHPTFHVSLLKPFSPSVSLEPSLTEEPPLPLIAEEGAINRVKEILESRRRGGRLEYLVDWESYGPEERSWVPRENILDPALLEEFHGAP